MVSPQQCIQKHVSNPCASRLSGKTEISSEARTTQEEIALICMEALRTKNPEILAKSWGAMELGCFRLFKIGLHCTRTAEYRTVIDGLLSLSSVIPSYKKQLLSCCLLLSCCSIPRWIEFVKSGVVFIHSELAILVAEAMTCTSTAWISLDSRDQELVAHTLMHISRPRNFEKTGYIATTTYASPLTFAIRACLFPPSNSEAGPTQYLDTLIYKIVNRAPLHAWESICNEDLLCVLKLLPESNSVAKELQIIYQVRISWYSHARKRLLKSYYMCPETAFVLLRGTERSFFYRALPPLEGEAKKVEAKEGGTADYRSVNITVDAYKLAMKWKQNTKKQAFDSAATIWLRRRQPELVAAAYIAAPNILRSTVEENPEVHSQIENLPKGLLSDLDIYIDERLASLLESIPEIAAVNGVKAVVNRDAESRQLRRTAILHPFLMLRRTEDFCAAGKVILFGLSSPSKIHSEEALDVLTLLLGIISELPYANSIFRAKMSTFMVKVFLFLVDEGRLTNGIPRQLEPVAILVLKNITICTNDDIERNVLRLVPTLIETNKNNDTLLCAFRDFQVNLKRRNPSFTPKEHVG